MNMIVKSAVASALALAATGAFAMGLPSSGSSDLVLIVQNNATPTNVYALDTGISLNSVMPTSGLVSNSVLSTTIAGINQVINASATLQAFLTANPAAGDGWTIEGGQYLGLTNALTKTAGNSKAIFSSGTATGNPSAINAAIVGQLEGFEGGYGTDVATGGLTALQTNTESTAVSYGGGSGGASTKYGLFGVADLSALGSTVNLFGLTGNNAPTGAVQSYILGTASLAANGTLTFAQNPGTSPVPLPAAVWLLGSGLMGLVGVSRRRKAAV